MKRALLFSGGMDSTCLAFWVRPDIAVTIDYGQLPAAGEIRAAKAVCSSLQIPHETISVDLASFGSGDLAGKEALHLAPIPEWWPYRNQLLLSLAAMWGISQFVDTLVFGALLTDAQHADGRENFFDAMRSVFKQQEGVMNIETPAIRLTSEQLVRESQVTIDILSWSHSCHKSEYACGVCRGCQKHFATWAQIGYTPY